MKLSLTPEQQLQLLKSRSLIINDEGVCLDFLKTTGYYRFSGYMRFFQENPAQGLNAFLNGISFEDIQSIYFMDDEIRGGENF